MNRSCVFFLAATVSFAAAHGQTYLTKAVRFEGGVPYEKSALLQAAALRDSGSFTKAELDAAVQKLADTGLFTATAYKIDATALVITLTPLDPAQMLPVNYANFVWWKPEEMTPLVHGKVPLFSGKLPANGNLLETVETALTALLKEKGIDARVDQRVSGNNAGAVLLSIVRPEIKVGDIRFDGATPTSASEQDKVKLRLVGEDFDEASTRKELRDLTTQIFQDDGYLDVSVEPEGYGAPRAAGLARYEIDLTAKLQGDVLYHVRALTVEASAPLSKGDVEKAVGIKAGDAAGVYALRTSEKSAEGLYHKRGFLDANAKVEVTKDAVKHEVSYVLRLVPGEVYHVAGVHGQGLTTEQQAELERTARFTPDTVADDEFRKKIGEIQGKKTFNGVRIGIGLLPNAKNHTVVFVVRPLTAQSSH